MPAASAGQTGAAPKKAPVLLMILFVLGCAVGGAALPLMGIL
jgi:hypothetical protein